MDETESKPLPAESSPLPAEAAPAAAESPEAVEPSDPKREGAWETLRSLLFVLIIVVCFRTFIAEATVVPTGSMEQTILIGDHVFLDKLLYGPRLPFTNWRLPPLRTVHRGDVVAFHYPVNPSQMFVKRVIAAGGDVVEIRDRKVWVNGQAVSEPYAYYQTSFIRPFQDNFPPPINEIDSLPASSGLDPTWARTMHNYIRKDGLHVPEGALFVLGDNRDNSLDSRFWGFVPVDHVVGEPMFVYWSYDAPTNEWTANGWGDQLRYYASHFWNFIRKTRWSRTGKVF